MPWTSVFVQAYCGDCEWYQRVESPDWLVCARVVRAGRVHQEQTGHNVAVERGQVYAQPRSRS